MLLTTVCRDQQFNSHLCVVIVLGTGSYTKIRPGQAFSCAHVLAAAKDIFKPQYVVCYMILILNYVDLDRVANPLISAIHVP